MFAHHGSHGGRPCKAPKVAYGHERVKVHSHEHVILGSNHQLIQLYNSHIRVILGSNHQLI